MFEVRQGATTKIPVKLVSSTDLATPLTGLSSFTVYYSKNGGAATAWSTPTVTELNSTFFPGVYMMTPTSAMTNTPGPLVLSVAASGAYTATTLVDVVAAQQIDTFNQISGIPASVWNASAASGYASGSFGRVLEIARKILTNKTVDSGGVITVYDDNGTTVLGTFTWVDASGTRTRLSGSAW